MPPVTPIKRQTLHSFLPVKTIYRQMVLGRSSSSNSLTALAPNNKADIFEDQVRILVRDSVFLTTVGTLTKREPNSLFVKMLQMSSSDANGRREVTFDRNPRLFLSVLNYLRTGKVTFSSKDEARDLLKEAEFYGCSGLKNQIIACTQRAIANPIYTRRENPNTENSPKQFVPESCSRAFFDTPLLPPLDNSHIPSSSRDDDLIFDFVM